MSFDTLTRGKPVVDATVAVSIKVRRQDIKGAIDRNPENCVVARCAKRSLNGRIQAVKIGAQYAYLYDGDKILRYRLSSETKDMVRAYDAGGFYPTGITAQLLPVAPTQRLGAGRVGGKRNGQGKPNARSASRPWLRHANQSIT